MIVVADVNTIWRRKPFQEMGKFRSVLGIAPKDILLALGSRNFNPKPIQCHNYREKLILMPPGWASRLQRITAMRISSVTKTTARRAGETVTALVVTSPHYLQLVGRLRDVMPTFYYCSDDYSEYTGWGGRTVLLEEAALAKAVSHSFFVSTALADRVVHDFGIPHDRVSVSPNATETAFLEPVLEEQIKELTSRYPQLRRPIVGVVGGINDRLDVELLRRVADLPNIGTLLMVGPLMPSSDLCQWEALRQHPKCLFVGSQAHTVLPIWMQSLDVALIPYRCGVFNRNCSPMRLFDHLAAGKPIVATANCLQVLEFDAWVQVAATDASFIDAVTRYASEGEDPMRSIAQKQAASQHLWSKRAAFLSDKIAQYVR
jgi:glycosyltransferase involved in cell wall biosynthesis